MEIPPVLLTREIGAYFIAVWVGALLMAGAVAGIAGLWARLSARTADTARELRVAPNSPQS